jgi:hypothetical protein
MPQETLRPLPIPKRGEGLQDENEDKRHEEHTINILNYKEGWTIVHHKKKKKQQPKTNKSNKWSKQQKINFEGYGDIYYEPPYQSYQISDGEPIANLPLLQQVQLPPLPAPQVQPLPAPPLPPQPPALPLLAPLLPAQENQERKEINMNSVIALLIFLILHFPIPTSAHHIVFKENGEMAGALSYIQTVIPVNISGLDRAVHTF